MLDKSAGGSKDQVPNFLKGHFCRPRACWSGLPAEWILRPARTKEIEWIWNVSDETRIKGRSNHDKESKASCCRRERRTYLQTFVAFLLLTSNEGGD